MKLDKGKEEALETILDTFSSLIKIHIYKFNPQKYGLDPDDITQEIKIKIWKILHNEKEIKNYPSYIKKIVNSSVIDLLRKWKREEGILLHEKQGKVSETKNDYNADLDQGDALKETVAKAVNSLIESRRRTVKLFLLGLSIVEISAFYGWSHDKTRNLLYRGLADLKEILRNKDIDYENK